MMDKNLFQMKKIRAVLIGLAGAAALQAFFIIGQAYFLAKGITNLWNGQPLTEQLPWISLFAVFFLLRQGNHMIRDRYLDGYAYKQARDLRKQLLKKVFVLGPNFVQKEGTGKMVTTAIEGTSQVENYISLILPKMTNMMVIPWIIAAFIFTQDHLSAVVVLLVFPIIILFMIVLGYAAKAKADRQYAGFQKLSNHFLDTLRGLETLRFLGLSKRYEKNIYKTSEDYRKATMSTLKVAILSTFALDFFTTLSVAIVAVFLGLKLVNGGLTLFPALLVLILTPDFFLPIRDFSNDYHATLNGGNTLKEIFQFLNVEEPVEQSNFPLQLGTTWQSENELALQGLSLRYQKEAKTKTLKNLNFTWKGYGKIGIIGASGSGKSTLIKLLGGFLVPEETDQIALNGEPVAHLNHAAWQQQLCYIPQAPYIFHGTLKDNISFYIPDASEEAVMLAVKQAGLSDLVAELPQGLATMIGEGAQALSGGQLQRIALARAFLDQQRKILLFDEPTAHLDVETEAEIKATILPLFNDRLVFFATHRLHWMKDMDYILVMENGEIVEAGRYEELKANPNSAYQRLVREMKGGQIDEE